MLTPIVVDLHPAALSYAKAQAKVETERVIELRESLLVVQVCGVGDDPPPSLQRVDVIHQVRSPQDLLLTDALDERDAVLVV
jgi:hypothetical protein